MSADQNHSLLGWLTIPEIKQIWKRPPEVADVGLSTDHLVAAAAYVTRRPLEHLSLSVTEDLATSGPDDPLSACLPIFLRSDLDNPHIGQAVTSWLSWCLADQPTLFAQSTVAIATHSEEHKSSAHLRLAGSKETLGDVYPCLLYTSPSPRDQRGSRMPSSA